MKDQNTRVFNYVPNSESSFKKGVDLQRECYKNANLQNNYEVMLNALENIKVEIKIKAIAKDPDNIKRIKKVENIIKWYKSLPMTYKRRFESGYKIAYPPDIDIKINLYLNDAYEILIGLLITLGLL